MQGLIVFLALLAIGYGFGRYAEQKHFASLREREREFSGLLTFSTRIPPQVGYPTEPVLVAGNTVVSVDYFKQVLAGLRSLFGGRVSAYESLVERARREALLRMKSDARSKGAEFICNVRLETASISKGASQQLGSVEVYAYGTGFRRR